MIRGLAPGKGVSVFDLTASGARLTARRILHSSRFDNVISSMIILNAFTIGIETDACAVEVSNRRADCATESPELEWRLFEVFFCTVFSAELALRIYVKRAKFLFEKKWSILWNWFDFVVVLSQLVNEAITLIVLSGDNKGDFSSLKVLRVIRILRVVRIFRLVRVLHLISELRTIVSSILGSLRSLMWTVVLLFLMIYIVGVFFTQTITDHMADSDDRNSDDMISLTLYYGSLAKTVLSLWQSITGGADWDTMARPMINEVHPLMGIAFCAYIAFAILALMNVVTGVFVQTALQSAQTEEDSFLTEQIVSLFKMARVDRNAKITLKEIQAKVSDPLTAKEWRAIKVSGDEARYLFDLLDVDQSGSVFFEEFLSGCIRLRGLAKSIDTLTMMQEARACHREWRTSFERLEHLLHGALGALRTERRRPPHAALDGGPLARLPAAEAPEP
mmetsp:Transcript_73218/g.204501  ORF Transcript_73218/g.204501 Transcript_73218/m.204501 type:complete len:448 (-) Transcript_73218:28-1371(-)